MVKYKSHSALGMQPLIDWAWANTELFDRGHHLSRFRDMTGMQGSDGAAAKKHVIQRFSTLFQRISIAKTVKVQATGVWVDKTSEEYTLTDTWIKLALKRSLHMIQISGDPIQTKCLEGRSIKNPKFFV